MDKQDKKWIIVDFVMSLVVVIMSLTFVIGPYIILAPYIDDWFGTETLLLYGTNIFFINVCVGFSLLAKERFDDYKFYKSRNI